MAKRKGLLLDQTGDVGKALKTLGLSDWEFQPVRTIDEARKTLAADSPLVGLVVFDSAHPWPAREMETLVSSYDVEWIAVLGADLLRNQSHGPMILRSFHDFHTLPLDRQRLDVTLGHAYGKAAIFKSLDDRNANDDEGRFGMTGRHPKMIELYRQIEKIVTVDAPVLIGGESGTGKELVAAAIHRHSERAKRPFVTMNCGAIPSNLIQSELFGYERGAFTGASQRKIGNIEAANDGVLFLDEIGDLPLDLQANLLRFLQEKTIVRVGSTERLRVNVRVIAATHVDLARAVEAGQFREDLYYRLNVLHLKVPPLRDRASDIPLLADRIFHERQHQKSPQVRGFSSEALHAMREYTWPGNVRELINRVQYAMLMTENKLIGAADLGIPAPEVAGGNPTLDEARATVEKEIIVRNMHKYQNNVSEVARQLGISRVTLYRMIDRLKIDF
ncbi:MAG: sigma-54 dependent transcriptional regulator [Aromatoleum sp.]|jgi:DNA-binding NtrC family response regulator|uniref:sigma-54 dependent transcriptional regulator n=1 Tax=Aromatoleum sp. TaxID=2307007 RepID=UPI002895F8CE|nr:sigma-54 dependent transcriptional regulator [Aromatoleum sp.]MDT3669794.1 sigma-54 dependent transcriptional regulator [Aromatoleum sp.]